MSSENAAASATPARTFGFVSVLVIGILAATQSADPGITSVAMPSIAKDLGFSGAGLSLAVSIGGACIAVWFASKVFRIGLLLHGKPPSIGTLIKWARMS